MHVNKVSHVYTINHVAKLLGRTEEALEAMAETMDRMLTNEKGEKQ